MRLVICPLAAFALLSSLGADAATITRSADFDRWMYPFNSSPGTRSTAPVFGAVGTELFDDFDGEFLVGFNTAAAGLPTSLPAGKSLKVTSVQVTATHSSGAFTYDPTFDSYASYLPGGDPDAVADSDAGRPIELWGAGLRGGFTKFAFGPTVPGPTAFEEGDIFAFADPTQPKVRNAFAFDPLLGDVSNPVSDRLLSASPWAVGTTVGVTPGSSVQQGTPGLSAGSTFTFDVDLSHPGVVNYLQQGIAQGGLYFTITSLAATTQGGSFNPNFYTRDNFDPAAIEPSLTVQYEIVPEPTALVIVICGLLVATTGGLLRKQRANAARRATGSV